MSSDNDSEMVAFWNNLESDVSAGQTNDALQPASVTEPAAHPAAEYPSAEVQPASVVEPAARDPTAEVQPSAKPAAEHLAAEDKKEKVLQWLDAVQQHRCPNTQCAKCGRRGNWRIVGVVSRNVFTYVAMYKKKSTISKSAVDAIAQIIDA